MWFYWFDKDQPKDLSKDLSKAPIKRTVLSTVIRGSDWFIENDRSYEIQTQECVPGTNIMCIDTNPRPTDWVGPLYLETIESPMEILKEDAKGVLFRRNGWMGVHWFSKGEWKDIKSWI